MNSAREKIALANKATGARDYQRATDLANQTQADARLAQNRQLDRRIGIVLPDSAGRMP